MNEEFSQEDSKDMVLDVTLLDKSVCDTDADMASNWFESNPSGFDATSDADRFLVSTARLLSSCVAIDSNGVDGKGGGSKVIFDME